jgi:site-specific DNA-adenine methylase
MSANDSHVVSYPGAKWRFYPHMREYFPDDMKTFIEPFLGGASVTLSVADDTRFSKLERMVAGELYPEMWSLWQGVKQNPSGVKELIIKLHAKYTPHQTELHNSGFICSTAREYLPGGKKENFMTDETLSESAKNQLIENIKLYNVAVDEAQNFWNWAQSVDPTTLTLEERAARMILVNKYSFSGMGDAGSLSKDRYSMFNFESLNAIDNASKLLQRVEIYNVSFEDTMNIAKQSPNDTFIFLDPPYAKQEDSALYGKNGSTHKGFPHQHFADFTKEMPCKWFVTYDDSVVVRKLFAGDTCFGKPCYFKPFTIPGGYTMAQVNDDDALAGEELFITNYPITPEQDADDSDDEEYDF